MQPSRAPAVSDRVPVSPARAVRRALPTRSEIPAFNYGLHRRDRERCVICLHGITGVVHHCHIVPNSEDPGIWEDLKAACWIPDRSKSHLHEPRNGITMCKTHHAGFERWEFFVRFVAKVGIRRGCSNFHRLDADCHSSKRDEYVFVNFRNLPEYAQFHDRALRLDPKHRLAPFITLLVWHERIALARRPLFATKQTISFNKNKPGNMDEALRSGLTPNKKRARGPMNASASDDGEPQDQESHHPGRFGGGDRERGAPQTTSDTFTTTEPGSDALTEDTSSSDPAGKAQIQPTQWIPTGSTLTSADGPQHSMAAHSAPGPGMYKGGLGATPTDCHSIAEDTHLDPEGQVRPARFTIEDIKRGLCFHDGQEFRPIEERHLPRQLSDENGSLVPLPEITDIQTYCSVDNMRAMGFRNVDDISQEGEENRDVASNRQWGETAEEAVRLWHVRRALMQSVKKQKLR
jgi:hypothetical protein